MRFNIGDTVEVRTQSAFRGDVGEIISTYGPTYQVEFESQVQGRKYRVWASFASYELRHAQQRLEGMAA